MHGEVTEGMIIGGNETKAERIVAEHNERARLIREAKAAATAGALAVDQDKKNGASMDSRPDNHVPEIPVVPRHFTVDI